MTEYRHNKNRGKKSRSKLAHSKERRTNSRHISVKKLIRAVSALLIIINMVLLIALFCTAGLRLIKGESIYPEIFTGDLRPSEGNTLDRLSAHNNTSEADNYIEPQSGEQAGSENVNKGVNTDINADSADTNESMNADRAENVNADISLGISSGVNEGTGAEGEEKLSDSKSGEPIRLLFGGDVYLSSYVLEAYDKAGGASGILDASYRELIENSDLFVVNEEFPMSKRGTAAEDKEFTFRVPPERANILKEMGIDVVTLANNHTLDFGREALMDTISILDNAGIAHTGAGKNREAAGEAVIKEIDGVKVAILGATRVIPSSDWAAGRETAGVNLAHDAYKDGLLDEVRELSKACDYVITYLHWGTERKEEPEGYMRTLAKELADAGADLIIGAHPHVLQGAEYIGDTPVIYSLGNFLFGSSIPRTMLLSVDFYPSENRTSLNLYPGSSTFGSTSAVTGEKEKSEFYEYYEGLSFGAEVTEEGELIKSNTAGQGDKES